MTNTQDIARRCDNCGKQYPGDVPVCPTCHTILVPLEERPRTPAWVIVMLILIIVVLAGYAGFLAYDILVRHNY